jgi:8-oxo-dGTP pyrophosphatase MutT (NUDIX family)
VHVLLYSTYQGGGITNAVLFHATLWDAVYIGVVGFFVLTFPFFRRQLWIAHLVLLLLAIGIELWALSTHRWTYNELMPIIPGFNVGLSPTLQLATTGLITFLLVFFISKRVRLFLPREYSYGVVPFVRSSTGVLSVLLVRNKIGTVGLPKGHKDKGESPKEAAIRELKEETGITDVTLVTEKTFSEQYQVKRNGRDVLKTVMYFVGTFRGEPVIRPGDEEISAVRVEAFDEALKSVTFPEIRKVLQDARVYYDASVAQEVR